MKSAFKTGPWSVFYCESVDIFCPCPAVTEKSRPLVFVRCRSAACLPLRGAFGVLKEAFTMSWLIIHVARPVFFNVFVGWLCYVEWKILLWVIKFSQPSNSAKNRLSVIGLRCFFICYVSCLKGKCLIWCKKISAWICVHACMNLWTFAMTLPHRLHLS